MQTVKDRKNTDVLSMWWRAVALTEKILSSHGTVDVDQVFTEESTHECLPVGTGCTEQDIGLARLALV